MDIWNEKYKQQGTSVENFKSLDILEEHISHIFWSGFQGVLENTRKLWES